MNITLPKAIKEEPRKKGEERKPEPDPSTVYTGRETVRSQHYESDDEDYQGILASKDRGDHSRRYSTHIANQLSGAGLKSDPLQVSKHVLEVLRGGGHRYSDLLHTYVHGRVPLRKVLKKRQPITDFSLSGEHRGGGSLPSIRQIRDGVEMHSTPSVQRQINVV